MLKLEFEFIAFQSPVGVGVGKIIEMGGESESVNFRCTGRRHLDFGTRYFSVLESLGLAMPVAVRNADPAFNLKLITL